MVRHEAAEALGGIATDECLPVLQEFAQREDVPRVVRESCEVALDMVRFPSPAMTCIRNPYDPVCLRLCPRSAQLTLQPLARHSMNTSARTSLFPCRPYPPPWPLHNVLPPFTFPSLTLLIVSWISHRWPSHFALHR